MSHLRDETGVLPLRAHLELCSQQFYAIALHPNPLIVPKTLVHSRQPSRPPSIEPLEACGLNAMIPCSQAALPCHLLGRSTLIRCFLRGRLIDEVFLSQAPNKLLWVTPPPLDPAEQLLPGPVPSGLYSPTSAPATVEGSRSTITPTRTPPTTRRPTSTAAPHIQWTCPLGICGTHPSR